MKEIEIKKWEGFVLSIDKEKKQFWARLKESDETDQEALLPFSVINDDITLLEEGALFNWTIGSK